jgi:uncharacterized Ntn-hydrolase superfamily protein
MKKINITCLLLLLLCSLYSQDTFSIVAVDPETGEVGSAGASCVPGVGSLGGVILLSGILPGKGGVNAQAYICIDPHINLDNAISRMEEGLTPEQIIAWLENNDACFSQNFDPTYRQYGIASFDENGAPQAAAYSGVNTDDWKGHRVGSYYSIQGNILLGPQVVDSMEARFLSTEGSLAVRLMAAMQGANIPGADSRCLDDGTSSTSAFLRVFRPDDTPDSPYLELNVAEAPTGVEPIDSLQSLFNEWALTSTESPVETAAVFSVQPNPSRGAFTLQSHSFPTAEPCLMEVYSLDGRVLFSDRIERESQRFSVETAGAYILRISNLRGQVYHSEKLIVVD